MKKINKTTTLSVGDAVQFVEGHKWCGALGFISELKPVGDDCRVMIGCTIPDNKDGCNTAYIFSMGKAHEFEKIGRVKMMPGEVE